MAVSNLRIRVQEQIKRFSFIYYPLRAFYRKFRFLPGDLIRRCCPSTRTLGMARGFYSGIQQVRSGARAGRVVLESQLPPAFPDNTLVRLSNLEQDKNQPWPVFWLHEKNAYLSGPSLCLRDESARLMAESTFSQTGYLADPSYGHFALKAGARLEGNVTSIVSNWGRGEWYWHWLMDSISRLALLPECPPDTRILVRPLRPWAAWFLREMGLEKRWIETTAKALWIDNYYFLAPSSMTGCWNPFAISFLREKFLGKASSTGDKPKRFYVVREGFTRGVSNESEVRDFFRKRGWGLVAPETLSIPDQIELFSQAEAVVALHGSALTNLIWSSPGCRVLEFVSDNYVLGSFEVVARALDLPHDFMICPGDHRFCITVDLGILARKLEKAGL